MVLPEMSPEEQEVIRSCLRFVINSDALEGEFSTRMGLSKSEVRTVLTHWPAAPDSVNDGTMNRAVDNALNEVCNGVRFTDDEWSGWFAVSPETVLSVFQRWRSLKAMRS